MSIPESQLDIWSHQGSVTQSRNTYQTIKNVLEEVGSGYSDEGFKIFLQGSYGNDTNIYSESDVDVVIRLDSIYRPNIEQLTESEKNMYREHSLKPTYTYEQFKSAVVKHLEQKFGSSYVSVGNKAIKVKGNQNRRDADVVVCYEYRKYRSFNKYRTDDYISGIIFPVPPGEIINYPKQHMKNCTSKHQLTSNWFKPMVRILKNMKCNLVGDNKISKNTAPSYFIEGLLYNVPNDKYGKSYVDAFCACVNWLREVDKKDFVCANEQYYLLRENSHNCWPPRYCDLFLNKLIEFWNSWN